jgi:hypothetical protein
MIWKHKPGRSEEYLEYIRGIPCYICSVQPVHPHHVETAGVGIKGSDYSCVPLCPRHHRECHDIGRHKFEKTYKVTLYHAISRCLIYWVEKHWGDEENG